MSDILSQSIPRPYFAMSTSEQVAIASLIKVSVSNGCVIVLGDKHCFFCGCLLGEVADTNKWGQGERLIYIKACLDCAAIMPFK